MEIAKIIPMLNSCDKKILSNALKGASQSIAYAFEFQLILVGERVNGVMELLEKYTFNNKKLFIQLLKQSDIAFDEAKVSSLEDTEYFKGLFRQAFNKTLIGNSLMFLNSIRNKLKHTFVYMQNDSHEVFRKFYIQAEVIQKFLSQLKDLFDEKLKSEEIINNLFTNQTITALPSKEMESINALFPIKKKNKVKKLSFEEQKAKVLEKLKIFQKFLNLLNEYGNQLEIENKKPGKWHAKDHTPLHATCMCLVALGETANGFLRFYKNVEKYDKALGESVQKYKGLLDILFEVSKDLTHEVNKLPNAKEVLELYLTVLEESKLLLTLATEVEQLKPSVNLEQKLPNEPKVQTATGKEPAVQAQNMIQSITNVQTSFFASDKPQNEEDEESKKRKLYKAFSETEIKEEQPTNKKPNV